MADIVLVQPPIKDFYLTAKRTVPYGLACIASPLLQEGFSVEIVDALASKKSKRAELPPELDYLRDLYAGPDMSPFCLFHDFRRFGRAFESIGQSVGESGPFLVGVSSLFSAYSAEAIETAKAIRARRPEAVIVFGGHHPTEMPEEVLGHECVDFIIRGEGEAAMVLLAQAIRGKGAIEAVPGIGFKTSGGRFFVTPPAVLADLDEVPLPAVELIDNGFYGRGRGASAVVAAGRGCPLGCSYCSIGCSSWCGFRMKSAPRLMEEIRAAVLGGGARFIDFEDENISFRKEWFLGVLAQIEAEFGGCGLELRAMNGLYPPSLDEEVIYAMKKAGFTALNLSLCTTDRKQLKKFGRPDVREGFERALFFGATFGLDAVAYIIVGAPGQDPMASVADLIYLADKNAIAGVSVFYPAPGSLDFTRCEALGIIPEPLSLFRSTALPISDTTTRQDSVTLLRLGRILNFCKSLGAAERQEVLGQAKVATQGVPKRIPVGDGAGDGKSHGERRREMGKILLGIFLRDGAVCGVSPQGRVFCHSVSDSLCQAFRNGLLRVFA
ncbi:MAG: radical SAM protein [Syntrophobacteraceae bacterium]|nr:radical SAM protein [Syntrophobacteraceae bacterium]